METGRKPIQIAGVGNDIYALCDDGSIWCMGAQNDWVKMISIPKTDGNTMTQIDVDDFVKADRAKGFSIECDL